MKKATYQNIILTLIFCALCVLSYQLNEITNNKYQGLNDEINKSKMWVNVNGGHIDVDVMNKVRIKD